LRGTILPGIVFGVGSPSRSNLQPRMEQFGDARMTAREANAIVQSAFPAAYEWWGGGWGDGGMGGWGDGVIQMYKLWCNAGYNYV